MKIFLVTFFFIKLNNIIKKKKMKFVDVLIEGLFVALTLTNLVNTNWVLFFISLVLTYFVSFYYYGWDKKIRGKYLPLFFYNWKYGEPTKSPISALNQSI